MTSGIIQILIDNVQVQTAIGLGEDGEHYKVFPVTVVKEQMPYVTVKKATNTPTLSKDCFSTMDTSRYELRVWSTSFIETEEIHEVCRRALETGTLVETSVCDFRKIWLTDDFDAEVQNSSEQNQVYCHIGIFEASVPRVAVLT